MITPGDVGWPVADVRCKTCMDPHRDAIEAHLDAGTKPPMIERILRARGIPGPSEDSIRNHGRRHRAAPAAMRQVREATEHLDQRAEALAGLRAMYEAVGQLEPGTVLADARQIPGGSPADSFPMTA
jgi:hypothetical protein